VRDLWKTRSGAAGGWDQGWSGDLRGRVPLQCRGALRDSRPQAGRF
jgi:hypothetical protein